MYCVWTDSTVCQLARAARYSGELRSPIVAVKACCAWLIGAVVLALASHASFLAAATSSALYVGAAAVIVVVTGGGAGREAVITLITTAETPNSTAAPLIAHTPHRRRACGGAGPGTGADGMGGA